MPGYQVGTPTATPASAPYPAQAPSPSYPQSGHAQPGTYPMNDFERSYSAAPADAVDRGAMTYDDVIVRTATLLGVLMATGAVAWGLMYVNPLLSLAALVIGGIAGFVLAMVNIFSSKIRPA